MKEVCKRKKGYATRKQAKHIARKCLSRNNVKLTAYKCPHCGFFHLTSKTSASYKVKIRCVDLDK